MAGRNLMEKESINLSPVVSSKDGLPVYFLTGKNYLYQTLYCIQSLALVSSEKFQFILVDDGSFNTEIIQRIEKQLPGAKIVTQDEISLNLADKLPQHLYPCLHHKRMVYPHIKKLTDVHTLPGTLWKLVLDSDMLFWDEPVKMINWLRKPTQPIHMVDCVEAYGYSKGLMEQLCSSAIAPLINVGAIGLNSDAINWGEVETWVKELEKQEGASYYLEQALTAMLIGTQPATVLDAGSYIVNPANEMIKNKLGTLHHYVDLSKQDYFKWTWKQFIKPA